MWRYLQSGGLRLDVVAHRRWGKDDVSLHWAAVAAHTKVGTYWHMLPEAAQARKAIWDAINPRTGKRRIDEAFPKHLIKSKREQDMFIQFKNGSTWQVLGSDNYDSYVGSPPTGVVFSEWSLANPNAWGYVRPILLENGGWAVFIWTPRGRNHATRAFEAREADPAWFAQRIPAVHISADDYRKTLDTLAKPGLIMNTPVFTAAQLSQELKEMVEEAGSDMEGLAKFNSEYLVDFDAAAPGAYYAKELQDLVTAGRRKHLGHDPLVPVDTAWDLGMDDYTAIWFFQRYANHIHVIDYYETSDVGLDTIVKEAFENPRALKYKFNMHYLPHDVNVRELGASGQSRKITLRKLGVWPIRAGVPRDQDERVNAVRRILPHTYFDLERTQAGFDRMKAYKKRYNKSLGIFVGPLHDEASHAADAFGELAINAKIRALRVDKKEAPATDRWATIFNERRRAAQNWKTL